MNERKEQNDKEWDLLIRVQENNDTDAYDELLEMYKITIMSRVINANLLTVFDEKAASDIANSCFSKVVKTLINPKARQLTGLNNHSRSLISYLICLLDMQLNKSYNARINGLIAVEKLMNVERNNENE